MSRVDGVRVEIKCRGAVDLLLSELADFQGNLKSLSKQNYARLKKEILSLGFSEPFSVWKSADGYKLLNGHQRARTLRQMATEKIAMPDKFPCSIVEAQTEAEAKRKVLALTSQYGEIEGQGLYEFISAAEITLDELEDSFRFPEIEFREFRSEFFEAEARGDEIPTPPLNPVCKAGDLWRLGGSKIICADSQDPETYKQLFGADEKATLFSTDPPYFVSYSGSDRPMKGRDWSELFKEIDEKDAPAFLEKVFANALQNIVPDAPWYVWHADKHAFWIRELWEKIGVHWHQTIIWVKPSKIPTHAFWHYQHEPCLFGYHKRKTKLPKDGYWSLKYSTVWAIDYDGAKRSTGKDHPTQKPLEIFARPIRAHTKTGDIVLEPFSGSGSQIVAATQLDRRCYAVELQPAFVDVAIQRWEKLSGQKAEKV